MLTRAISMAKAGGPGQSFCPACTALLQVGLAERQWRASIYGYTAMILLEERTAHHEGYGRQTGMRA